MSGFKVLGSFGHEQKMVEVYPCYGSTGNTQFEVMVGKYYEGRVIKEENGWVGHFNEKSELDGADVYIIGELIENGDRNL